MSQNAVRHQKCSERQIESLNFTSPGRRVQRAWLWPFWVIKIHLQRIHSSFTSILGTVDCISMRNWSFQPAALPHFPSLLQVLCTRLEQIQIIKGLRCKSGVFFSKCSYYYIINQDSLLYLIFFFPKMSNIWLLLSNFIMKSSIFACFKNSINRIKRIRQYIKTNQKRQKLNKLLTVAGRGLSARFTRDGTIFAVHRFVITI